MRKGDALQVHCDGGFNNGAGAAAFVVHAVQTVTSSMTRLGYMGTFIPQARSAFETGLVAITMAVEWILRLKQSCMAMHGNVKRVMFTDSCEYIE